MPNKLKFMLLLVPLAAGFSFVGGAQILLLHGWIGDGGNWDATARILAAAPYNFPRDEILTPTLPNRAGLVAWAGNIAAEIDTLPVGTRLTVIAHSFAGPAVLLLLIAAHHITAGDYEEWIGRVITRGPGLAGIGTSLRAVTGRERWTSAAARISRVVLYHPALGGGCHACAACNKIPIPGVCDAALRDMCALSTGKAVLFSRPEIEALRIPIVDIYGTQSRCLGPCLGMSDTDGCVSQDEQRLGFTAVNYHEIKGKPHCHTDFIGDLNGAAADLCALVFPTRARSEGE